MSNKNKLIVGGLALIFLVSLPILAFSSHNDDLYVNAKASSQQDGSSSHPYKTIKQAIKKGDHKTEIHVAKGVYEENITLKKGMELLGEDKDNTVIKAKKSSQSTVTMEDDSKIDGFTIKRGKRGILIKKSAKVSIINCIIKYNKRDGIFIQGGNTKKSHQVVVSELEIRDNGQAGIYSTGARRVVIMDSEIRHNKSDGIDLAGGTSAWIAKNKVTNNGGSGLKLVIDSSDIWTKSNSIRRNKREGIEVSFSGEAGRINIAKTKIANNNLHGIAKIQKASLNSSLWNKYLTMDSKSQFWGNRAGNITQICFVK